MNFSKIRMTIIGSSLFGMPASPTRQEHHSNSAHFQNPIPTEAKDGTPDKSIDVME